MSTALSPNEAFDYVADLRNLRDWDPGVDSVDQVAGDGPEPESSYAVTLGGAVPMTLCYETAVFAGPRSVTLRADTWWLTSTDVISVIPIDGGSIVTYDADLRLKGPLRLGDLLLRPTFRRIGDAAATGLRRQLDGEFVG